MEPMGRFPYYEDTYGKLNREEFAGGPIEYCGSDGSDKSTSKPSWKPVPDRSFRQFTKPSGRAGSDRFGVIKEPSKRRSSFNTVTPSDQDIHAELPTQGREQSSPTSIYSKLAPMKYGMFATASKMLPPNSAGEELDAMLGTNDIDGPDYGFQTLEPESENKEDVMRKDTPATQELGRRATAPADGPFDETDSEIQSASGDGDVEDNASELGEELKKEIRAFKPGKPRAGGKREVLAVKTTKSNKPKYSLRRGVQSRAASTSAAGTPRRSARQVKAEQDRKKQRGVRSPTGKAKQIAASNRSKMTARAATLRARPEKVDKAVAQADYFKAVYGRKRRTKKELELDRADTTADEQEEYYRTMYGKKAKAEAEDILEQYEWASLCADVIPPAVARAMEKVRGLVVVGNEDIEVEGYVPMF